MVNGAAKEMAATERLKQGEQMKEMHVHLPPRFM